MKGTTIANKLHKIKEIENSETMNISSNSYSTTEISYDQDSNNSLNNSFNDDKEDSITHQKDILNAPLPKTHRACNIKLTQNILNFKLNDGANNTNAINNKYCIIKNGVNTDNILISNNKKTSFSINQSILLKSSNTTQLWNKNINAKGISTIFPIDFTK